MPRRYPKHPESLPVIESAQQRAERVKAEKGFQARFLMREAGITEAQALDLIELIGNDTNSLLREARLLKK
ncbi:hypothetical protein [Mesorhizobium sp.]|uniref:hypothetical protein n=1 Tax=Mesorhizobium sp. TaxID=1871066 RepID=UPI000FE973FE|nr:hypothetical protein [Mesorhizobium sp.]RWM24481.1 MAG: hypothetical protein EOR74_24700 [Mesorhizobium sp.]RWM33112.1 MAG: hypothetical protein EOR75_28175 [Mesorhizobium sp.]TIO58925.1 MAG: hypothetical protein E5X79_19310 [Mesorhizobium sp.]TJV49357.1 MAG: hypothetical protein E5Y01_24250 [Mesorhizobium sp.]